MLVVDIQAGLFQLVHDHEPRAYRNNIIGYSALAKYFELPTVITTSAETGPNGPVPREIVADHPNATVVRRQGEVNAWDSKEFRDAVEKTGKKQLVVAGITTDVCVTFLALCKSIRPRRACADEDARAAQTRGTGRSSSSRT